MHNCLDNFELLEHISSYLKKIDLLSFALTCKHIKPVAINTLWRDLSGLGPVIQSFPRDKWQLRAERVDGKETKLFDLLKPLSRQDWNNVLPYLPKIRFLTIGPSEASDKLLEGMLASFPGATMFPQLCRLTQAEGCTDVMLGFISASIGPRLEHLSMNMGAQNAVVSRAVLLSTLRTSCHSLKTFKLALGNPDLPAISASICRWNTLQELHVPALTEVALIHISQLPGLRRLVLHSTLSPQFPSVPPPAFPALRALVVNKAPISFGLAILKAIASPSYRIFRVGFFDRASSIELKALFDQLTKFPSSLLDIAIHGLSEGSTINHNRPFITTNILRCLLPAGARIGNLRILSRIPDLHDEFVLDVAKACPRLVHLVLGTYLSSGHRSDATLISYAHVAQYCPSIATIGFVVDASKVDASLPSHPIQGIQKLPSHSPFTLLVGDSWIVDPAPVAAFFSSLLSPCIKSVSIETALGCPGEIKEKWAAVERLLPLFLTAREQESSKLLGSR